VIITFCILGAALVLFIWGRWRYDVVAFVALILGVLSGVVPFTDAYSGLGHPAVITVAAALVMSRGLQRSGLIDRLAGELTVFARRPLLQSGLPPAQLLMPISFGSMLGGLTTLIGTPPNIIIGSYREEVSGSPFALFDFAPVGVPVAIIGVLYITFLGWRLIPKERRGKKAPADLFEISDYVAEVQVPEGADIVGKSVREVGRMSDGEVVVVGIVRGRERLPGTPRNEKLQEGDILMLQADPAELDKLVKAAELELAGKKEADDEKGRSVDIALIEAVLPPGSRIEGRTPGSLRLRSRGHLPAGQTHSDPAGQSQAAGR
jgi:di/tricarboxylate transporter